MLLIKTELYNTRKKTAVKSFNTSLAKNKMPSGATFLSSDIINIRQIPFLKITGTNKKQAGKVGFALDENLKVKVRMKDESGLFVPVKNIPVKFVDKEKGINYGTSWSDDYGNVKLEVTRVKNSSRNQVIVAELDLDSYLSIKKENDYLNKVLRNAQLPSANFYLTISPSLVYFNVLEKNFGEPLGVPKIEPSLKKYLSEAGYNFTDIKGESDLVVTINADTRKGGEISGIYFSFVDVNISIRESVSQKEIFKKSFNGYKGAGGSFEHAGAKSYRKATQEICPLVQQLLTK